MSRHSFEPEIAQQVGINAAVIYQNIYWWCERNKVQGKNYIDGRFWTYNSVREFGALFPYLTAKQVRTALDKLVSSGLLLTGQFNKMPYDRTKWYCPSEDTHLPCVADVKDPYGEPIPDVKPVIKPDEGKDLLDGLEEEKPKGISKKKVATEFSEDWEPSVRAVKWAESKGFRPAQIQNMSEACRDFHISKGNKFMNHDAAFRTWASRQGVWLKEAAPSPTGNSTSRSSSIAQQSRQAKGME